jgi:molybdenum cofactor guanylyltransferase
MTQNISGVILAGGTGKRFNYKTKANIVVGGKTIISRITETLKDVFEEIIIVANNVNEIKIPDYCSVVADHFIKAGPLGGIHAALKASSGEAVFVFATDMPFLDKSFILRQIDYYCDRKCDVLVPRIGSFIEPLHAIYNQSVLNALEQYLTGENDRAVRAFFKVVDINYMDINDSHEARRIFTNINTPGDMIFPEKILGSG